MKSAILLALLVVLAGCGPSANRESPALAWAYPKAPKAPLPSVPPGLQTVPGSAKRLTLAEVSDENNPVDWFPDEHPPAPAIVAHGASGGPTPCAECHMFSGQGFPGAPDLAGLPAAYIVEQVQAFRSGERRSAQQPDRPGTTEMIQVAKKVSDADLKGAAQWFAALPRRSFVRVVETDTVPVTKPDYYGWLDLVPGAGTEPIRGRIIEVPEDTNRMYLEDPHTGVVDYVSTGALARGAALVKNGGPNGQPCASCHGRDLNGMGATPHLAGRSAPYLARMLWDIKTGARGGPTVVQMKGPASGLDAAQITDVAAYLASLKP